MIIAIDGPAASGKSTTAIGVAKRLGITYLDTGAMYRAVTFGLIENDIKFEDSSELDNYLKQIKLKLSETKSGVMLKLDGRNISEEIRSSMVTENVSEVSALKNVRHAMVLIQRKIAKKNDCILEGRDIGTVVFPNADFKFFLIADEKVRAKRRQNDLKKMGEVKSIDNVTRDIIKRDYKDSNRKPITNKEIAKRLKISESTVSRIVKNKYIQLPDKLIPLKELLQKKVNKGEEGRDVTPKELRDYISLLISEENSEKPLSDEKIRTLLSTNHLIKVARRTVTKYREVAGIGSSRTRRTD